MASPTIQVLKRAGCSAGAYKKIFTAESKVRPKAVNKLIELIANRVRDGRNANLSNYRMFWAIDCAYEAPHQQISPTLIRNFLQHDWKDAKEALESIQSWGLKESDLFLTVKLEDAQEAKVLNPPFLYQILVPIVKSYLTIRLSKLFNERDNDPLLPYKPAKLTPRNQVLCEVLTDVVNTICNWFGYPAVMREAIFRTLKYGLCLAFPRESWYEEKQLIEQPQADGSIKDVEVVSKEGIRYYFPHPTRMFHDLLHPATTFNSDTGCEYAGYWHVTRYGDILDNRDYWNRESIWFGTNWFSEPLYKNYFAEVYPCQLQFPQPPSGANSRENVAAFYNTNTRDKAIFITEFFMKLCPSDWGLGSYSDADLKKLVKTYDHKVWHRFVIAGDDTVIYAEPLPYNPVWFMGYDYDPDATKPTSFALEAIPWQDQITNIISQMVLSGKENLANVIFYDKSVIPTDGIRKLEQSGNTKYVGMNFIGIDTLKLAKQGVNVEKAFHVVQLSRAALPEMIQMMSMTLNIMERVLQITAQEAGSSASHQQSKEEIVQTGGASQNRINFTGSFIDDGCDAWQRQLHDAWQSFGGSQIVAEISPDIPELQKILGALGFKVDEQTDDSVFVSGNKNALMPLRLESFARRNNGPNDSQDQELAKLIFSLSQTLAGQPDLAKKVGVKNILTLLEEATRLGGGRKDFKLPMLKDGEQDQEVPPNIMQAIQSAQQATLQTISEKLAKPIAGEIAQDQQKLSQIEQVLQQLEKIYQIADANQQKQAIKTSEAQHKMQLKDAEFQADQKRKDAAVAADIARKDAQSQADVKIKASAEGAKAAVHAEHVGAKTAANVQAQQALTSAKQNPSKA